MSLLPGGDAIDVDISWLVYESLIPGPRPSLSPIIEVGFEDEGNDEEEEPVSVDPAWLESIPPRRGGPPTLPPDDRARSRRKGPPTLPPEARKKATKRVGPPTLPPDGRARKATARDSAKKK